MNSDFKLYNMSVSLYSYITSNIMCSIPKVHNDIRIHLLDETYSLVRNIISASYTKGNVRNKNINEILINISMIDALLSVIIEMKCIEKRKISSAINLLTNIKNIVYAWKSRQEAYVKESN